MTAVTIRGLTAAYGHRPVLSDLDLQIPSGEITAVLGASGSGKTTLLRVLAGFLKPLRGVVRFGDRTIVSAGPDGVEVFEPPEKRRVGIVPQEGALFPHLSVAANVGFGLPRGSAARVDEVLRLVGMADRARARPQELSGGQQQRVALARALAPRPDVILLDEPFSSLDASLRVRLRAEVGELLRSVGTTAVLVTHDQEEALSGADHVAVVRDGRVVQMGTPQEVYDSPADLGVARFVGEAVELSATALSATALSATAPSATALSATARTATELTATARTATELTGTADPGTETVSCALGPIPVRGGAHAVGSGIPAVVMLRPEQLVLRAQSELARQAPDTGGGLVREVSFYGHDSLLRVELADGSQIPVRVAGGSETPRPGDRVEIGVRGEGRLFPA